MCTFGNGLTICNIQHLKGFGQTQRLCMVKQKLNNQNKKCYIQSNNVLLIRFLGGVQSHCSLAQCVCDKNALRRYSTSNEGSLKQRIRSLKELACLAFMTSNQQMLHMDKSHQWTRQPRSTEVVLKAEIAIDKWYNDEIVIISHRSCTNNR